MAAVTRCGVAGLSRGDGCLNMTGGLPGGRRGLPHGEWSSGCRERAPDRQERRTGSPLQERARRPTAQTPNQAVLAAAATGAGVVVDVAPPAVAAGVVASGAAGTPLVTRRLALRHDAIRAGSLCNCGMRAA